MAGYPNISATTFPSQRHELNARVKVVINSGEPELMGTVIRADAEHPYLTLFQLDDGRVITSQECVFTRVNPLTENDSAVIINQVVQQPASHYHIFAKVSEKRTISAVSLALQLPPEEVAFLAYDANASMIHKQFMGVIEAYGTSLRFSKYVPIRTVGLLDAKFDAVERVCDELRCKHIVVDVGDVFNNDLHKFIDYVAELARKRGITIYAFHQMSRPEHISGSVDQSVINHIDRRKGVVINISDK